RSKVIVAANRAQSRSRERKAKEAGVEARIGLPARCFSIRASGKCHPGDTDAVQAEICADAAIGEIVDCFRMGLQGEMIGKAIAQSRGSSGLARIFIGPHAIKQTWETCLH